MSAPSTTSIYINGRFLTQQITGVQRFAIETCRALQKAGVSIKVLSPRGILHEDLKSEFEVAEFGAWKGHLWEQFSLPSYLRKESSPLLLNLCNAAPMNYQNHWVCIHDLAFKIHPEWFRPAFRHYYNFLIPKIAAKAKGIFTVSETVKKELMASLHLSEEKVKVVYNGVSSVFEDTEEVPKLFSFERPYLLALGGTNPRKNNLTLIDALDSLDEHWYDVRIVGRAEQNFQGVTLKEQQRNYTITFHENVSDQELKSLYQHAEACVYPSHYEGFGIPPLEAIHQGCPVILSNIQVFKELYSEAAIFMDGIDVNAMINVLQQLKQSKSKDTENPAIQGIKKQYTYTHTAKRILEALSN